MNGHGCSSVPVVLAFRPASRLLLFLVIPTEGFSPTEGSAVRAAERRQRAATQSLKASVPAPSLFLSSRPRTSVRPRDCGSSRGAATGVATQSLQASVPAPSLFLSSRPRASARPRICGSTFQRPLQSCPTRPFLPRDLHPAARSLPGPMPARCHRADPIADRRAESRPAGRRQDGPARSAFLWRGVLGKRSL